VLPVGVPELQGAQQLGELRVNAGNPNLLAGSLAVQPDLLPQLVPALGDHLLDPGGMDATIAEETFERVACHLPTYGIEGAQHDRLRRVVDDHVHPGRGFKGADIAPLPTDDPTL